jgi:hypothetical protein
MPTPSFNLRRRRISKQQLGMLHKLVDGGPRTAVALRSGMSHEYAMTTTHRPWPNSSESSRRMNQRGLRNGYDDPKTATKAAKRGLERLKAWGLVRLFKAPHPEADKTRKDYWAAEIERQERLGFKGWALTGPAIRARSASSIVPSGNRRVPVLWAEITEAGRTAVTAADADRHARTRD